jgi:hypothetical protein
MVDYYGNELYTSKDWKDTAKFYDLFDSKREIIDWMRSRPKAKPKIVHYNEETDNYAVVVIPTIDTNSKWSKNAKHIFDKLHIVFAENRNKKPNPYFNYSKSVNEGVKAALHYNPEWVIISNDDMIKEDHISKLITELKHSENYDTVFFPKTNTYSSQNCLYKPRIQKLIRQMSYWRRAYANILNRLNVKYELLDGKDHGFVYKNLIYKKDKIKIKHHQGNLIILNTNYIRRILKGKVFDDTFINGHEDSMLSYKYLQNSNFKMSEFRISAIVGGSLGTDKSRWFREIANEIYFEYKTRV